MQELNRQKAGFASAAVAASIAAHLDWLDRQIETVFAEVRRLVEADAALRKNLALVRSITGFGEISAAILLAELPNIAEFTPRALRRSPAGMSAELTGHSRLSRACRRASTPPAARGGHVGISRIGSERLRRTLFMCALSAKRTNKSLAGFVARMAAAGKPPKVVLVAVARKLLVYAHAVVRTQRPFDPSPKANSHA